MLVPINPESINHKLRKSKRRVLILGATGSIGTSALEIIDANPDQFEVIGLVAGTRGAELRKLAEKYKPKFIGIGSTDNASLLKGISAEIAVGVSEISDLCRHENVDVVLAAMVGVVGLKPVLAALEAGKLVALANKESLVAGGSLVKKALDQNSGSIIPVDSEHSALFQALQGERSEDISRLILTASGGPFLNRSRKELSAITPEQAVKHPRWNMGPKISIDSATMFNKALEVIEAYWLYGIPEDRIHVVIHPQSIIHSMVEFCDGSQIAQLSHPDMKGPISYALRYPNGRVSGAVRSLNLEELGELNFTKLSYERFPAVALAHEALRYGGNASLVLNTANEVAVELFMQQAISFTDIESIVAEAVSSLSGKEPTSFDDLVDLDVQVRAFVKDNCRNTVSQRE